MHDGRRPYPTDGQRARPRDAAAAPVHGDGHVRRRAVVLLAIFGHALPELLAELLEPRVDGLVRVEGLQSEDARFEGELVILKASTKKIVSC